MWKKFCVSILSICLLGGATLISGSLFAADESTLRFSENTKEHHYVNDEFSYTLTSDRSDETILYVGGENYTAVLLPIKFRFMKQISLQYPIYESRGLSG